MIQKRYLLCFKNWESSLNLKGRILFLMVDWQVLQCFTCKQNILEPVGNQIVSKCHQCGSPSDSQHRCNNERCYHLFVQCEACRQKYKGTCSEECKTIYELPKEEYLKIVKMPKLTSNYALRVKPRLPYAVQ